MTRRPRGFTLIEIVVAVGLTAFIGSTIGLIFSSTIAAKETFEAQAEKSRMLRVAMSRMCRELSAAYVSDRYDSKRYRDAYDRPTNFIGERDRLTFTTFAHQRLYADAKESDQMVVEYSVKASPDRAAKGRSDLVRREKAVLEERMDRGGTEDSLFEGATKVEFEYWNSERQQWESDWDTRRKERKSVLPPRVRISLYAKDEAGKEVRFTTQTRILLNTELPRYQ